MKYLLIAIATVIFIFAFKIQKIGSRSNYFAFSSILNGIVTYKMLIGRVGVIILENMSFYLVLQYIFKYNGNVFEILFVSNFLGSLLIVWPVLYSPKNNIFIKRTFKNIALLYVYCFLFIAISFLSTYVSRYFCYLFFVGKSLKDIWEDYGVGFIITILFACSFGGSNFISKKITNLVAEEQMKSLSNIMKEDKRK